MARVGVVGNGRMWCCVHWQIEVFVWGFSGFGGVVRNPPPLSGTRKMMPLFCCDFINALPRFMND